ncbi:MAG: taurine dioxygenase [Acidimicrobiia bacterium]
MATTTLEITRQEPSAGAIVTGVDLASLDDATFRALHAAFLEHHVLAFRGQDLTPDEQLAFAARWGTISHHPYVPSLDGHPGVMEIFQVTGITETWHADTTQVANPPKITMLLARELPACGGATMFANMHQAYDGLSTGLRATIDGLRAVHYGTELAVQSGVDAAAVTHSHPVAITHPETGRKALFVNADYVRHFDGWTPEESQPLLAYLYSLAGQPEYQYRHRWQVGDLVMWDNRSVQHRVVHDYGDARRYLHRVTIEGDPLS